MKNAVRKGHDFEVKVAEMFVDGGACTYANAWNSGRGLEKLELQTDAQMNGKLLNIECKNQKTIALKKWWEQACKDASLSDRVPVVALHLHNTSTDLVVLEISEFVKLVRKESLELSVEDKKALKELQEAREYQQKQREERKKIQRWQSRKKGGEKKQKEPSISF